MPLHVDSPKRGQRRAWVAAWVGATAALAALLALFVSTERSGQVGGANGPPGPRPNSAGSRPPAHPARRRRPAHPGLIRRGRAPGGVVPQAAERTLARKLSRAIAVSGRARRTSCLVVAKAGHELFSYHSTMPLIPASNVKLLTVTAVLDDLGTHLRIPTLVEARSRPTRGVLYGNVYLVGRGDPFLRTRSYVLIQDPPAPQYTSLARLAAQLRRLGLDRIDGSVVGDGSYFDNEQTVRAWSPAYIEDSYAGPLNALDVDDGYQAKPPYERSTEPPLAAASAFEGLLNREGVKVKGRPASGRAPASSGVLTSLLSPPMGQVADQVLRDSDDTGAELLLKQLGRRRTGSGSTAAGLRLVRKDLEARGLPLGGYVQADGSGLARSDRATCLLLADDLSEEGPESVLARGLPVAGRTGTLVDRLVGTPAMDVVHAKTGTLDGVVSLSGFVLPHLTGAGGPRETRDPILFSFIANGSPGSYVGDTTAYRIADILAEAARPGGLHSITPRTGHLP